MPKLVMMPGAPQTTAASTDDLIEKFEAEMLVGAYGIKNVEMCEEYTGHVKNLVKLFETFSMKTNDGGDQGMKKGETIATTTSGKGLPLSKKSNKTTASTSTIMSAKDLLPASAEERISQLESKMGAVVTFVNELVVKEIDIMGKNYIQQVSTNKNIDSLKKSLSSMEDLLELAHGELDDENEWLRIIRKSIERMWVKMQQMEKLLQTERNVRKDLRGLVTDINKNMGDLSNTVERIAETVERLASVIPKIKERVENEETIKNKPAAIKKQVDKEDEVSKED